MQSLFPSAAESFTHTRVQLLAYRCIFFSAYFWFPLPLVHISFAFECVCVFFSECESLHSLFAISVCKSQNIVVFDSFHLLELIFSIIILNKKTAEKNRISKMTTKNTSVIPTGESNGVENRRKPTKKTHTHTTHSSCIHGYSWMAKNLHINKLATD